MSGDVGDVGSGKETLRAVRRRAREKLPATKVEVSVSARNVKNADVMSKSDPMCVLFIREFGQQNWREVGRTEKVSNNLNPDFARKFELDYFFEEKQYLRFELYDIDRNSPELKHHDPLGCFETTLGNVVSCMTVTKPLKSLKGKSVRGTIIAKAELLKQGFREQVTMKWRGTGLDKKDVFGKSDPYLEFAKEDPDTCDYTVVYRSEYKKKTLEPDWDPFKISVQTLCNGNFERPLRIRCYDWNRGQTHDFIGETSTTLKKLSTGPSTHNQYMLINKKKKEKHGEKYTGSGQIVLESYTLKTQHTFYDYISGGTQIQVTVAVDFTASNNDPDEPSSLHYRHDLSKNHYSNAITSVVSILEDYDSDKQIYAYGFGAYVPPNYEEVSHMFPLNGKETAPKCLGYSGVLAAYQTALQSVKLHGPTNFAPIIKHVAKQSRLKLDGSLYHILLIVTDGVINDMPETVQTIVGASGYPLSIIIVGVGTEDFEAMRKLDADNKALSWKGVQAERDIVQFVEFNEFTAEVTGNLEKSSRLLAREVLAEVPGQVCSFMKKYELHPYRRSTLV